MSYNDTRIRRCEPHRPSWIQFYADEVQERDQKPLGETPSRFHEFTYKGDNYRLVWPRPYLEEYSGDLIVPIELYKNGILYKKASETVVSRGVHPSVFHHLLEYVSFEGFLPSWCDEGRNVLELAEDEEGYYSPLDLWKEYTPVDILAFRYWVNKDRSRYDYGNFGNAYQGRYASLEDFFLVVAGEHMPGWGKYMTEDKLMEAMSGQYYSRPAPDQYGHSSVFVFKKRYL